MPRGVGFFECGFVTPLPFRQESGAGAVAERFDLPALRARRRKCLTGQCFALLTLASRRLGSSERRCVEFRLHEGVANRDRRAFERRRHEAARVASEVGAEPFDRRVVARVRGNGLEQARAHLALGMLARFQ